SLKSAPPTLKHLLVTLSCMFDTPHKLVEWSALSIEWNMVDKHAKKSMVYTLEDGRAHVYKEGSVVNETRLRQSDASLQLHNVTVGDEGLYTCRVINPLIYTDERRTGENHTV
uniref:Ig-like domain-containing protein n=1 Tax=Neolamprologus brichardi TaxID=32507 RepID=A0A3Q4N1G2_NEOBR